LPAWDTVSPGSRFDTTVEIANDYRLSQRNGDLLIFDGETLRTNLAYSRSVGERWALGAEAPYYHVGGGVLDDLIDGWHSAFNLPDGGRNARPEDQLLFVLGDPAGRFFRLDTPQSGWGDVQLKAARKVGPRDRFVVQGTVKLPTGNDGMLAGSGATDWSLTLLRAQELPARTRPAGYYWGVGVLRPGEPERVAFPTETLVYTAVIGGSWQAWRRTALKAQLDINTPFFDSPLEEIGETAVQITAGAWWRANERAWLELALVEDLRVSTAPDVVLQFAAHWRW
jgi:hypothetical protein